MDQADRDFFAANGYLNLGQVLADDEVQYFRALFDGDMEKYPYFWHRYGYHQHANYEALITSPQFDELIRHPKIYPTIEALMGGPLCFGEIGLRLMRPYDGPLHQGWHRDRPHWDEHPLRMDYIQLMVYLTDVNEGTHCFSLSPESVSQPVLKDQERQLERGGEYHLHGPAGTCALFNVAVLAFCLLAAAPFLVMGITTFQTDRDLYRRDANPFDYAEAPTLEHLDNLFNDTNYLAFVRNSAVVGAVVVAITLALALPAAYSLARLTGRWGERAGILMFIVYLVPPTLLFIPLFRIIVSLGLSNSLLSLIVVYPTITVPFSAWLLMGFFKSIPPETEEAALVDGYHPYGAFLRVALPLARPGIISVIVFSFTLTLHEFIYALVFIQRSEWRTLSVGVPSELILGDVFFWQPLLASALIVAVPVALVYNVFLDRLIQGFTVGAVKG